MAGLFFSYLILYILGLRGIACVQGDGEGELRYRVEDRSSRSLVDLADRHGVDHVDGEITRLLAKSSSGKGSPLVLNGCCKFFKV